MEDFDVLKREATKLERHLEDRVAKYQQLAQKATTMADHDTLLSNAETGSSSSSSMPVEEELLKLEIQRLLQQLQDLISFKLSPAAERSNKSQHLLLIKRYREILFDLTSDFSKSQQMWTRKREQMELFSGANTSQQQQQDPAMEHLLRERSHIQNSLTASSSVIHQAMEIHSDLRQQGGSLRGVSGMIGTMTQTIPGLNRLVENIRRKKSRDDVIVAGVIAACILFTLWYVFGGK